MIEFVVITNDHVNMNTGIQPITRKMRFEAESMSEALEKASFHCRHYYDLHVQKVHFDAYRAGRIKILVDGLEPRTGCE